MNSWFNYLRQGLSRTQTADRLTGPPGGAGVKANLRHLRPFWARHWRKGVLGAVLILFNTLLDLPQPVINAYLIN